MKPVISFINDFISIELKSAVKGIEAITSLLSGDFKGAWEAIKESFSVFFNETFSLIFGKEKWEEFKNTIKKVFTEDIDPEQYVEENGLKTVNDEGALRSTIEQIVAANPKSVEDYRAGKKKAIGFLVGQTMKQMKGKADPGMVNQILVEILEG